MARRLRDLLPEAVGVASGIVLAGVLLNRLYVRALPIIIDRLTERTGETPMSETTNETAGKTPGGDRWEVAYAYQLREGDLVSGDQDAVDAMTDGGEWKLTPDDIDWALVHREARTVVTNRRYGAQREVTMSGDGEVRCVVDDNTPILRYLGDR
jgi:hypothetical protein